MNPSVQDREPIRLPDETTETGSLYALIENLVQVADRVGRTGFRAATTTEAVGAKVERIHEVLEEQVATREHDLREERRRIGEYQDRERRLLSGLADMTDLVRSATGAAERELGEKAGAQFRRLAEEVGKVIHRCGLEPTAAIGQAVDPDLHDVVDQVAIADHAAGAIVEVVRQGYRFNGVVVRPARIVVAE